MKNSRVYRHHIKGVQQHMLNTHGKSKKASVSSLNRVFFDKWALDKRTIIIKAHRKGVYKFWIRAYLKSYYTDPMYYDSSLYYQYYD